MDETLRPDSRRRREAWYWAFYDWANSGFATSVMAGFFPVFLKQYWSTDATLSTFRLGNANALAALVIVLIAPVLGAVADRRANNRLFVAVFACVGAAATAGLFCVGRGQWPAALVLYGVAVVGFVGGNVFYNALLVQVVPRSRWDRVSARGFALGYLGGGILFAINVVMVLKPEVFGLRDASQAVRIAFLTVALWWLGFALPLWLGVHEAKTSAQAWPGAVRAGLGSLVATFKHVRQLRTVWLFLLAYWLYIDGANTIVAMAVDYGLSAGLHSNDLIIALLMTQFVAFPAALVFGRVGAWMGARRAIMLAIAVYVAATIWAVFLDSRFDFYAIAVLVGLVQGGLQSLSRSYFASMIPTGKTSEFFGFYAIIGKASAVLGPLLVAWTSWLTHSPRASIAVVVVLFVAGAGVLSRVPGSGRTAARSS